MASVLEKEIVQISGQSGVIANSTIAEVTVLCPECKAFQTVFLIGNQLMRTRKFSQRNDQIFLDCGAKMPCRLYRGV
ncbi:MAG TPA: hypothetical protein VJK47_01030 [Dehalococcoidales bacterium]|nr:hypothetical protein [Dehalococcoidales bacterium]